MARPPVLPKLAIPSLAPPAGATRPGTTENQPLTALERGRGMQVPPTPVVVPPTPVAGGQDNETSKVGESSGANGKDEEVGRNGVEAEVTDELDFVIAESPEEDDGIDGWPTVGSTAGVIAKDSTSMDRKTPTSNGEKHRSELAKKGSVLTGRSRSRSGSSSSQFSGMAPRPIKDRRNDAPPPKAGLEEVVHSVNEVSLVDSPVDEVGSPTEGILASPVNASPTNDGARHGRESVEISPPTASPSATDPRQASDSLNPLTRSDSAIPSSEQRRSSSPEQQQIYDVISTSPAASACETPCLDPETHRASHHDDRYGFFPVQEDAHEDDSPDEVMVAESPGGLSDDGGEAFSAIRERNNGSSKTPPSELQKALKEEERAHVDSMGVAKDAALSHSADALRASRKRSEGFSPPGTPRGGALTPAGPGRGKERMLSVDDGMSETSSAGRGMPGSHRRTSSTHRVRETLDAKHYSSEMGERLVNQYKIQKLLGKGAYGNVYKAIDAATGIEYALKEFSKNRLGRQHQLDVNARERRTPRSRRKEKQEESDEEETGDSNDARLSSRRRDPLSLIRREIAIMKKLDHPNLVLLYEAIDVPTSDSLYLVLEFMSGGTIMDIKLGSPAIPLETEVAREYFRQLVLGLEYLHENDVAHRDIKPDNILLSADRKIVKLCDFGVSEFFEHGGDDLMKKNAGSPAFMSPEAAISSERNIHAKAVDIWSLGVTLYCLLRGRLPFEAENPLDLYEAIRDQPVPVPGDWSRDVQDLVRGMLTKDPHDRINMSSLRAHAWVTAGGAEPLPSTEENLFTIGKQVVEPTQEELGAAITSFRQLFTVLKVIQRLMRNVKRNRRTMSTSSYASSPALLTDSAPSSAPGTPDVRPHTGGFFTPLGTGERETASPMMMPIPEQREGSGDSFSLDR